MWSGILFLAVLTLWAAAPPCWLYRRRKAFTLWNWPFAILAALIVEFGLVMVLALMNAITYNGIFNWKFWLS